MPLLKSSMRRIISNQPLSVHNCISRAQILFEYHQTQRKAYDLLFRWKERSRQERKLILDNIDTEATELFLSAENSCRKLRVRVVDFSPVFEAWDNLEILTETYSA